VVDGGSSDKTLDLVRNEEKAIIIDDSSGNRATARQKGIQKVDTRFFAFVDSDVILCNRWHEYAWRQVGQKTGAVWGVALPLRTEEQKYYGQLVRLRAASNVAELIMKTGGYLLHDTLIRYEAVESIRIPSALHVREDYFIGMYITNRGYEWIRSYEPYCWHDTQTSARDIPNDMILWGQIDRLMNWTTTDQVFGRVARSFVLSILLRIMSAGSKEPNGILRNQILFVKGWLSVNPAKIGRKSIVV